MSSNARTEHFWDEKAQQMVTRPVTADGPPTTCPPIPEPVGEPVEQDRPERTAWHAPQLTTDYQAGDEASQDSGLKQVADEAHANLLSSLGVDGKHYPVIDLDNIDLELRDSSTSGHTHLYINHSVEWDDYLRLLDALVACKLVEPGYVAASRQRGSTMVRRHPTKYWESGQAAVPAPKPGHVRAGRNKPIRGQLRPENSNQF